jgi:hypothetical protein
VKSRSFGAALAPSLVLVLILGATTVTASSHYDVRLGMMVPIDTPNRGVWNEAIRAAPAVGMIILNPDSGPGTSENATTASLVLQAQAAGIKIVGYVATAYDGGGVTLERAKQQVDDYFLWYRVDGIFYDEVNSSCSLRPSSFYLALYAYVKAKSPESVVVLNPGTAPGACYLYESDILVTFEDAFQKYNSTYDQASWMQSRSSSSFCNIILGAPSGQEMKQAIDLAVSRNVGWVYVTSAAGGEGNPYASLPQYFGDETAYVMSQSHPDTRPGVGSNLMITISLVVVVATAVTVLARLRSRAKVAGEP